MAARGILFNEEAVRAAREASANQTQMLRQLGITPQADNYRRVREAITRFGLEPFSERDPSLASPWSPLRRDEFVAAYHASRSLEELLDAFGLGLSSFRTTKVKQRIAELGLDELPRTVNGHHRIPAVFQDEEMIKQATTGARSPSDALLRLGMPPSARNQKRLVDACTSFGIRPKYEEKRASDEPLVVNETTLAGLRVRTEELHAILRSEPRSVTAIINAMSLAHTPLTRRWIKDEARRIGVKTPAVHAADDPSRYLAANTSYRRKQVRKALLATGQREVCTECGVGAMYNGKPITLHIDHIDGVRTNNTPENLRFLCPNCHSQTDTYCRAK